MSRLLITSLEQRLALMRVSSQPPSSSLEVIQVSRKTPIVQCVRWYRPRKPFWYPTAKSKMFRVHVKPVIPKEEEVELSRLYNVYRTNMKSIRQHFKEQLKAQITGPEVIEERKLREADHHARCIIENNEWNIEVAKLREERLAKEAVEREKEILEKIVLHEKKQKALADLINSQVREVKEASKTFITPANIDEAIEIALDNVIDHNFSIDTEGNVFKGRYGKPPSRPKGKPTEPQTTTEELKAEPIEARN